MLDDKKIAHISDAVELVIAVQKEQDIHADKEVPDLEYYEGIVTQAFGGKSHRLFSREKISPEEIVMWWQIVSEEVKRNLEEGLDYQSLVALLDEDDTKPQ